MKLPDFPDYIQFFPTFRCNNNCSFCFNRGLARDTEASLNDCKKIIEKVAGVGTREIDILGGEPTLYPQIIRLVDIAAKSGMHAFLSSNGSNIGALESLSEEFSKELLTIGVSINSDTMSDELRDFILKCNPVLKGICTKSKPVPEAAYEFINAGIKYYMLFMDTLVVDDLKNCPAFHEFFNRLNAFKKRHENIEGVYCSGFIPDKDRQPVLADVRCPAGVTKLSVLPDGSIYPCYLFFRHAEFRLGNIITDSFETIWSNPILNFFRQFRTNNCPNISCEIFFSCHGGCPAISLLVHNDPGAPDPRCVKK